MPMLIDYIDKIARDKQRDVLFLVFNQRRPEDAETEQDERPDYDYDYDYEADETRQRVLRWFEENGIAVRPCGPCAGEGMMMSRYQGQLYLEVPFDRSNPDYQKVENFLEHADGSMKIPGVSFHYLPLEEAMKYADQDDPAYWEKVFNP